MRKALLFFFCLILWAADAKAQTVTDERAWFVMTIQETPANSPWRWTFETIIRSHDGVSGLDSFALRPTFIYALDKHSSVGAGYVVALQFPSDGVQTGERRLFGQYVWTGGVGGGALSFRTRMESRYVEGNSSTVGRLRQQVRFSHVVRKDSKVSVVAYDELLVHVNDTSKYARGVDQNRSFGGLGFAPTKATKVEIGYLNQFLPGHRGAADRMNHILSSAMVVSF